MDAHKPLLGYRAAPRQTRFSPRKLFLETVGNGLTCAWAAWNLQWTDLEISLNTCIRTRFSTGEGRGSSSLRRSRNNSLSFKRECEIQAPQKHDLERRQAALGSSHSGRSDKVFIHNLEQPSRRRIALNKSSAQRSYTVVYLKGGERGTWLGPPLFGDPLQVIRA